MFPAMYFVQECPICGRNLQVRLEYLGRTLTCQHCQGRFVAQDPATQPVDSWDSSEDLLSRADELLAVASGSRTRPR